MIETMVNIILQEKRTHYHHPFVKAILYPWTLV